MDGSQVKPCTAMAATAADQAVERDGGEGHGAGGERAPVDRHVEVGEAAVDGAQQDRAEHGADHRRAAAAQRRAADHGGDRAPPPPAAALPPRGGGPPITAAAIACSSKPVPMLGSPEMKKARPSIPERPQSAPISTSVWTRTRGMLMPLNVAASGLEPMARTR